MSFTTAAKNLFVTQPALSAQIKLLEDSCSFTLFRRGSHQLSLTIEAETLLPYMEKVFHLEKEVEQIIEDFNGLRRGIVRLGTTKTTVKYSLDSLMLLFRPLLPNIKIKVEEGTSMDML